VESTFRELAARNKGNTNTSKKAPKSLDAASVLANHKGQETSRWDIPTFAIEGFLIIG
jgi:hypothetical protein